MVGARATSHHDGGERAGSLASSTMRAIVLAGGAGSRLRPLTDTRPKPLLPFCGQPFAAGLLHRLADVAGHVTFVVGADAAPFEALSGPAGLLGRRVDIIAEPEPWDTAGAARTLLQADPPADPVLVVNGDVLTDADLTLLVAAHRRHAPTATLALARVADPSAYGVVVTDGDGRVERFVEKPAPGSAPADTVNAGLYVLDPCVFERFPGQGPLSFEHDVFPGLLAEQADVRGHVHDGYWADLGTPARYLDGTAAVLRGRCEWPLPSGFERTASGSLQHASARVADDATVGADSVIGAHAHVASGATLEQAVLFERARVGSGARLRRVIAGEGATVAERAEPPADTAIADHGRWPP